MKKIFQNIADYVRETDKLLLLICIAASLYGCVLVFSATYPTGSSRQAMVQLISVFIGVILAIIISMFDYKSIAKGIPVYIGICLVLLAITYFFGYAPAGSENKAWISLPGGMSFQPSELLKITFILTFAKHVTVLGDEINKPKNLLLLCVHGLSPAALIMILQKDLGTSIILGCVFIAMMFAAGVKLRYFLFAGILGVLTSPLIWFFGFSQYQRERFTIIFNLESDIRGIGWQQWNSLNAIGSGGFFGYGFLKGPRIQSETLPKAYNDFIFATAGEELGILGCIAIVILLVGIVIRILRVAIISRDKMGLMICIGVFAMFSTQAIINIGMCLAVLPVIGITLPFFSAGGTSLICLYLGIGLVVSVFIHRNRRTVYLRD